MAHAPDGHWVLQIRTLRRDVVYTVHVRAADTVAGLKRLLAPVAGIAVEDQRLVCAGRALMDAQRLREFETAATDAPIFLVKRPRLEPDDAMETDPAPAATPAAPSNPATAANLAAAAAAEEEAAFWASATAFFAKHVPQDAAEHFAQRMRQAFNALQRDHPPPGGAA